MKFTFLHRILSLCAMTFVSFTDAQAQGTGKLEKQIMGTWILQKIEARINPNAKTNESKENLENAKNMQNKMMPPVPSNRIALVFEKNGKLKTINSMTKPEMTSDGTWQLKGNNLSIKSMMGELFENVVVKIDKGNLNFTIISPTGQFTAESAITLNATLKKGTLKDLDYSAMALPEPPQVAPNNGNFEIAPEEKRREDKGEVSKIIIVAKKVACEIGDRKECYLFKLNEKDEWQVLTDEITDFGYEKGYEYTLEVQREGIKSEIKGVNYYYNIINILKKTSSN